MHIPPTAIITVTREGNLRKVFAWSLLPCVWGKSKQLAGNMHLSRRAKVRKAGQIQQRLPWSHKVMKNRERTFSLLITHRGLSLHQSDCSSGTVIWLKFNIIIACCTLPMQVHWQIRSKLCFSYVASSYVGLHPRGQANSPRSPDPHPHERMGSGNETSFLKNILCSCYKINQYLW